MYLLASRIYFEEHQNLGCAYEAWQYPQKNVFVFYLSWKVSDFKAIWNKWEYLEHVPISTRALNRLKLILKHKDMISTRTIQEQICDR